MIFKRKIIPAAAKPIKINYKFMQCVLLACNKLRLTNRKDKVKQRYIRQGIDKRLL